MAMTETSPTEAVSEAADDGEAAPATTNPVAEFFGASDHRTIGKMFVVASLVFLAIDLVVAAVGSFDLASGGDLLADDLGLRLWANLPLSLILCGLIPLMLGLAIHIVPSQIGASAVAFPRAAALSFWAWVLGAVIFGVTWAFDGAYGGTRADLPQLGNVAVGLLGLALVAGSVCVAVTVLSNRTTGMGIAAVPFFSFASLAAATLWVLTLPALVANVILGHIGDPGPAELLLEVHPTLEWFFRQPAVYVAAIPVLGLILDAVSATTGSRARSYGVMQFVIGEFALLSFGAWAQSAGASQNVVAVIFALVIVLPVIAILGGGGDMVRRGSPSVAPAFVGALGAGLLLVIGTITGALQAIDTIGQDELIGFRLGSFGPEPGGPGMTMALATFVAGAVAVAGLAGLSLWRRPLRLAAASMSIFAIALAVLGGLVGGGGFLIAGLADPDASGLEVLSAVAGAGLLLLAIGVALGLVDLVASMVRGASDDDDDDDVSGGTLEYASTSEIPAIVSPYPLYDRDQDGGA